MQNVPFRWDDLRVVIAVFRGGSLKAAAASLEVNVSTVSRRLDSLEDASGLHLFDRTPEGAAPTEAAERLLPFAEQMESASLELSHAIDGFESTPTGLVRLTAPPGLVDHFLGGPLAELSSRYPALQIEVDSSIGYSDLTRREADIALRIARPTSGDLVSVRTGTSGFAVVASPARVRKIGKLSRAGDTRWVTYGPSLNHLPETKWIVDRAPETVAIRSNSLTAQIESVRAGAGATVVPAPFKDFAGLAEVPLTRALKRSVGELPSRGLWLVGHRALRSVPRVAVVWDFLLERLRAFAA